MKLLLSILLCALVPYQSRIAIVGDSHMEILGPTLQRRFRRQHIRAEYLARRGWGLRRYRTEDDLGTWLREQRPSVVIFAVGSNDYGIGRTSRYRPYVDWALHQVPRGACVLWYGPTAVQAEDANERMQRVAANHDRVAEMQREALADHNVRFFDTRPLSAAHIGPDGFHLHRRGYSAWASHVVRTVMTLESHP